MGTFSKILLGTILVGLGVILWAFGGLFSMIGFSPLFGRQTPAVWLYSAIWLIGVVMVIGGFYVIILAYRESTQEGKKFLKEAIGEAIGEERKEQPQVLKCKECGFENPKDSQFCSKCGRKLEPIAAPEIKPVSTVQIAASKPTTKKRPFGLGLAIILVIIIVVALGATIFFLFQSSKTHTYIVRIECNKAWTGTIQYGANPPQGIEGTGTKEYTISWKEGDSGARYITSINVQVMKTYTSLYESERLWVGILDVNGHVLASDSTTEPFGTVSIIYPIQT